MSELDRLKVLAEKQKQEKAKIEGKLETLYEELEEMGFTSVKAAQEETLKLKAALKKKQTTFNVKLAEFKKKYATELSE